MRKAPPELSALLCVIAFVAFGCTADKQDSAESATFEFEPVPIGESATEMIVLHHFGLDWQQLTSFDFDLTDEYRLDWYKINAVTGETVGPPRIAGFHRGREVIPAVLDLLPGEGVVFILTYAPRNNFSPAGSISFHSTDHLCSRFVFGVESRE